MAIPGRLQRSSSQDSATVLEPPKRETRWDQTAAVAMRRNHSVGPDLRELEKQLKGKKYLVVNYT